MKVFGRYYRFIDVMIAVNVLVFIADIASQRIADACGPHISWLTCNFGLIPELAFQEPWRIVTSIFVHGGIDHLFMNTLALYFFGMYIMQILEERQLIRIYFLGGIGGSLTYLLLAYALPAVTPWNVVVVGASGALFAIGGALAVLRPQLRVMIFPFPVPMPIWIAEAIIFFLVLLWSNVAWEGHLGGLIAGAALGYYYKRRSGRAPENVYFVTRHY